MNNYNDTLTYTVPLSFGAKTLAREYSEQHKQREKAQQVYLNTLSVYAVEHYFRCMGFETDWESSDSYNPLMRKFMDIADLNVKEIGKFDCRFVLPNSEFMEVPSEAWNNRVAYFAVQLNQSLKQATIIGFLPKVEQQEGIIPLRDLQPIAEFPEYLSEKIEQSQQSQQSQQFSAVSQLKHLINSVDKKLVNLSNWLQDVFEPDWQSLETLGMKSDGLVPVFRNLEENSMERIKLIDLGLQIRCQSLALLVGIKPEADNKVSIRVQLRPALGENYLPPNIKLTLLSSSGEKKQEIESRTQDNYIQLKRWKSKPGTKFSLQITLNDLSITEDFLV